MVLLGFDRVQLAAAVVVVSTSKNLVSQLKLVYYKLLKQELKESVLELQIFPFNPIMVFIFVYIQEGLGSFYTKMKNEEKGLITFFFN